MTRIRCLICQWVFAVLCVLSCRANSEDTETVTANATKSEFTMGIDLKAQKHAVKSWARSLTDNDYNTTYWVHHFNRQPQNFFDHYAKTLSDIFKKEKATVNFALVGACDGTNDRTIRDRYLPNEHWRGVFVEPITMNFNDLTKFMETNKVSHRSHLIHGAATSKCNTTMIKMKRPTHEEKNSSLPHWMRRQIGAIVPFDKLDRPMTGGWTSESVRCVTGSDILVDWAAASSKNMKLVGRGKKNAGLNKMRAHVLKIDAEGHDFDVLMSFLPDDVPNIELPLLINFEAKSIAEKFPLAKQKMEQRGYVVADFGTDGFALLRGDRIYNKPLALKNRRDQMKIEEPEVESKKSRRRKRKGKKARISD